MQSAAPPPSQTVASRALRQARALAYGARVQRAGCVLGVLLAACGGGTDAPPAQPAYDLVFDNQRADGTHRLFRSAADGTGTPVELAGGLDGARASARADGRLLTYTSTSADTREPAQLMLLDLASGLASPLSARPTGVEREPAFAPDGEHLAYVSRQGEPARDDVFVARLDGTRLVDAVNLTSAPGTAGADDATPSWSPDGRQIAFASTRGNGAWALWAMKADGSGAQQLTSVPANGNFVADHHPSWSPDGTRIVFQRRTNDVLRVGILSLPGAGSAGAVAFFEFDGTAGTPVWSPDGTKIAFAGNLDGDFDIFVRTVDGAGPLIRIRHPGPDLNPAWLRRSSG